MKQIMTLAGLAAFFLAATILRVEQFADETDSQLIAWCYGIVMLAATVGPALIYVRQAPRYRQAREVYRHHAILKRRLRQALRELTRAKKTVAKKARAKEQWEEKTKRMIAKIKASKKEE